MKHDLEPRRRQIGVGLQDRVYRAVVVDDEFSHRRILVQILLSTGFQVAAEGVNGEDAVQLMAENEPDLLVLDYHMPRKNGLEALLEIRQSDAKTPILMCTTENERDKVLELLQAGLTEYIVKPIDRKIVLEKLEKMFPPPPPAFSG